MPRKTRGDPRAFRAVGNFVTNSLGKGVGRVGNVLVRATKGVRNIGVGAVRVSGKVLRVGTGAANRVLGATGRVGQRLRKGTRKTLKLRR
jgi:hypothetical protein